MSEEFSNKPPQKIERKEGAERPPRYRTISSEIVEPLKDGIETVRVVECNGAHHRRCVDRISYKINDKCEIEIDDEGKKNIIFADQLSREELGACDCKPV